VSLVVHTRWVVILTFVYIYHGDNHPWKQSTFILFSPNVIDKDVNRDAHVHLRTS
jgi:hypothetical protein